jgi:hypothetical protein
MGFGQKPGVMDPLFPKMKSKALGGGRVGARDLSPATCIGSPLRPHAHIQELLSAGHLMYGYLTLGVAVLPWLVTSLVILAALVSEGRKAGAATALHAKAAGKPAGGQPAGAQMPLIEGRGSRVAAGRELDGSDEPSPPWSREEEQEEQEQHGREQQHGRLQVGLAAVCMVPLLLVVPLLLDYVMIISPMLPVMETMAQVIWYI